MTYRDQVNKINQDYANYLKTEGETTESYPYSRFLENLVEHGDDHQERRAASKALNRVRVDELKARLEKDYGFVSHPKRDRLFEIAKDYGSSFDEIESYYDELSELLS